MLCTPTALQPTGETRSAAMKARIVARSLAMLAAVVVAAQADDYMEDEGSCEDLLTAVECQANRNSGWCSSTHAYYVRMQTRCIKTCDIACVPVTPPPSPHRTTRPKSTQTLPPFEDDPNWCQRGTKKTGEFLCLDGTRCAGTRKSKRVGVFVKQPAEYIVYYEACCNAHGGIENCPADAHFMQNLKFIQETDADNPGSPCNDHCCVDSHQDELGVAGGNRKCPEKPVVTTSTTRTTVATSMTGGWVRDDDDDFEDDDDSTISTTTTTTTFSTTSKTKTTTSRTQTTTSRTTATTTTITETTTIVTFGTTRAKATTTTDGLDNGKNDTRTATLVSATNAPSINGTRDAPQLESSIDGSENRSSISIINGGGGSSGGGGGGSVAGGVVGSLAGIAVLAAVIFLALKRRDSALHSTAVLHPSATTSSSAVTLAENPAYSPPAAAPATSSVYDGVATVAYVAHASDTVSDAQYEIVDANSVAPRAGPSNQAGDSVSGLTFVSGTTPQRSTPLPSHDNYSGHTAAAPQSPILYAVPMADDDGAAAAESAYEVADHYHYAETSVPQYAVGVPQYAVGPAPSVDDPDRDLSGYC